MIGVFIIPTGIGCEIGGHAGDATPAARLVASCCDKLIVHPNVVNASDINEMTENMLYVEGSILDRFLEGSIELKEVRSNKILVVANAPIKGETINSVSAARAIMGVDASIVELKTPFVMKATKEDGRASGNVFGWEELIDQVKNYDYDALAIHSVIELENRNIATDYFKNGGINPWGGVEAIASKLIASKLNKPVAHAPLENEDVSEAELKSILTTTCDPRMAAEAISVTYFTCVMKGLHKAPRIGDGLSVRNVDFIVSPSGCFGRPHRACQEARIPIIMVKENKTCLNDKIPENVIMVENYLEAMGVISSIKTGILLDSVKRPISETTVIKM